MADNNKYYEYQHSDFIRYRKGEMSLEERNAFEKYLQKNAFAEEAAEGFEMLKPEQSEMDINMLSGKIKKRTSVGNKLIYYRIAASVAILMIVSTIFIIIRRDKEILTISENRRQEQIPAINLPVPEPIKAAEAKETEKEDDSIPIGGKMTLADNAPATELTRELAKELISEETEPAISENSGTINPELTITSADKAEARSGVSEKKMAMARPAGAAQNVKSITIRDYMPPQPVIGRDSFNIYVMTHIRNPEPEISDSQVVVISFRVNHDSTISSMRIISSPGQDYSREARRLINEGPVWKPAEDNSIPVEDEVILRIVFPGILKK